MSIAAAHYRAGRIEAAAQTLRLLLERQPDNLDAHYSLAVMDTERGRWDLALGGFRHVAARDPAHFGALRNLGAACQSTGDWVAAADAYERAAALRPDLAEPRRRLAVARGVLGRVEDAMELYRGLCADGDDPDGDLARLAILRPDAVRDEELATLRDRSAAAPVAARAACCFALGAVLEARGDDDGAWRAYQAGNSLKRALLMAGPPAWRPDVVARENAASIDRIRGLFTAGFISANAGAGDATARPIFIIGMPRSGSSLVEQILASHPCVQGMGESAALWSVLDGRFPYPPNAPAADGGFTAQAAAYLSAQARRGLHPGRRLVDKTLDHHLHVGMIRLLFPEALILHVVRDPIAVGLACYRQMFAVGNETLYDLAEIAAEIRRYGEMMAHWREVLPGAVTVVDYEALVADPESRIRWLVTEVCGLDWDEGCLAFHRTPRAVATASTDQVRRPISSDAVARRKRFDNRLEPLSRALEGFRWP
jgi:Tfp pilus assembly protein PilF